MKLAIYLKHESLRSEERLRPMLDALKGCELYDVSSREDLRPGTDMVLGNTTQALHAYKIRFNKAEGLLGYLSGQSFTAPLPEEWEQLQKGSFGKAVIR